MPHIHVIVPATERACIDIVRSHKARLRTVVAKKFGYSEEAVAVIGHVLSDESLEVSDNLLPLELVVELGTQDEPLTDERAQDFSIALNVAVPGISQVNYGVWVREMSSNGFYEHKP